MTALYRRQPNQFRQLLPFPLVIKVQIIVDGRKVGNGRIYDLSLGGLGVLLDRRSNSAYSKCIARFKLPGERRLLELPCDVVHRQVNANGLLWGLVFTDVDQPFRDGERFALWQFLITQHLKNRPFSTAANNPCDVNHADVL